METTISIIVPVYNIIEYLPRCVESLRKQTYDKIEILLVDDGSTDGTSALCDALAMPRRACDASRATWRNVSRRIVTAALGG